MYYRFTKCVTRNHSLNCITKSILATSIYQGEVVVLFLQVDFIWRQHETVAHIFNTFSLHFYAFNKCPLLNNNLHPRKVNSQAIIGYG